MPDPEEGIPQEGAPWELVEERVRLARREGGLAVVEMGHGFFQRLYYLRGYFNLMRDFMLKPP